MTPIEKVKKYIARKKVDAFWLASAVSHIERAMNGNTYFVESVSGLSVRTKDGHVKTFRCEACAVDVASGKIVECRITYSFPTASRDTHRTKIERRAA